MFSPQLNENYEETVDGIVSALCADLPRRRRLVAEHKCSRRVENEFRYLNYYVREAALETVGEDLADLYLEEIGGRIGYAYTRVEGISERAYKCKKQELKHKIAKKLHLVD